MNLTKWWIEKQERPSAFHISSFTSSNNKKEGEKVVVIPELLRQEMAGLENTEKTNLSLNIQPKSNPAKWWQHFFSKPKL